MCLGIVAVPLTVRGAQILDVRIGEHPDFTRLVFEFDETPTYFVERAADGNSLIVRLDAHAPSERFSEYGRRIESVELETTEYGSVARIRLNGNDAAFAEQVLSSPPRIVLDISDSEPTSVSLAGALDGASESSAAAVHASDPELPGSEPQKAGESAETPAAEIGPASRPLPPEHPAALPDSQEPRPTETVSGAQRQPVEAGPARNPDAADARATTLSWSGLTGRPKWLLLAGAMAICLAVGVVNLWLRRPASPAGEFGEPDPVAPDAAEEVEPTGDADFASSDRTVSAEPSHLELAEENDGDGRPNAPTEDPPPRTAADTDWEGYRPRPRHPSGATTMASMSRER